MHGAGSGFGAQQIGRSDLHAGRTQRQGGRDPFRVGDAAGGEDRNLHGFYDLGHQGEGADLGGQVFRQKHPPMAARLADAAGEPRIELHGNGSLTEDRHHGLEARHVEFDSRPGGSSEPMVGDSGEGDE